MRWKITFEIREMPMTRTGRTFDQYLAEYVSTAPAEELELFEQHSEYYQLVSELLEMRTSRGLTQEENELSND